jgi:hypothetical protein
VGNEEIFRAFPAELRPSTPEHRGEKNGLSNGAEQSFPWQKSIPGEKGTALSVGNVDMERVSAIGNRSPIFF